LTYVEIIAMNKCPNQAKQLSPSVSGSNIVCWYNFIGFDKAGCAHAYYALFNLTDEEQPLTFNARLAVETAGAEKAAADSAFEAQAPVIRDLWARKDLGSSVKTVLAPHSCCAFRV
ncbi:MAG: hypothetical protein J5631_01735, partial [Spirochaetaceae bacterium]|nr:hypothetical protein [Spirochaetaceae bacterium]